MPTTNQTMPFGATIIPSTRPSNDDTLRPPQMLESPVLTPVASREDPRAEYAEKPIPPHSPFYQHPPASFERIHSQQNSKTNIGFYEKDLESGHVTPLTTADDENPFTSKISVDRNVECRMWPSRQTLTQQKQAEKQKRRQIRGWAGCAPLRQWWSSRFDRRQRLWVKIAIALFLVGVAVALGVGISKAVHGTYYSSGNGKQEVGDVDE
ncbi:hypothetical protein B0A50_04839 [Salinomyces thailandicus]|uniref:Uncharacterized protein n=1 Tax=Salinomyces thailandicus TaxID=706561 RepID=A0A4U0TZ23_9PEZI|nr:hypothetical protein B0A50_04839 [Salinomyces thailandica]